MYKKRWIAKKMQKALNVSKVLVLTGARQTGKTTLLRNEAQFKNYKYFSMDDLDILSQVQKDPMPILMSGNRVIIDEAQRTPNVFLAIKQLVDSEKNRHFILSGSANFLLLKKVSESLAGRSSYFVLYPFALSELKGKNPPEWIIKMFDGEFPEERRISSKKNADFLMFRGFLPPATNLKEAPEISMWWNGYVKTYLERDLRDISNISSLADFRDVMELLALRTGSLIDQSGISRDTGISQPTVHRYINLLEATHLFVKLRPFTKVKSKSITKTPKGYFIDTGLATYLSGYRTPESIDEKFKGHLFESMILANLLTLSDLWDMKIYFWRTRKGAEIDFVLEYGRKVLPVEVKYAQKVSYVDVQNLFDFIEITPNASSGIVIYKGDRIRKISSNVFLVPWTML